MSYPPPDARGNNVIRFPVERTLPPHYLTMRELCEHFRMSERWFRYRIAEGMPTHRCGKRLRFDAREVKNWMEERDRDGAA